MPQLNPEMAATVNETEGGSFQPLEPGLYLCNLREVEVREGKKAPYWRWTYEIAKGEPNASRRFWDNTSLSAAALWRLNAVFAAFGVPAGTDTDALLGRRVLLRIGVTTIPAGDRAGETTNEVKEILPAPQAPDSDEDSPF